MNVLEVVRGIAQIVAELGYDGAHRADGSKVEIGLNREDGHVVNDSRVMDGFNVRFNAGQLIVSYQAEIKLSDIYKQDLEAEVEQTIQDVVDFIKREYRGQYGKSLSLTPADKVHARAENTSRVRYFVTAHRAYDIGGIKVDPVRGGSKGSLEETFRAFMRADDADNS
jgi:hypothetical protein